MTLVTLFVMEIMMSGKTLMIAGYAPGLGAQLKVKFEREGYTVVGIARGEGADMQVDLTDAAAVEAMFTALETSHPPVTAVIHNAMQFLRDDFLNIDAQQFELVWRSMALSAFNVSRSAVPRMIAHGGGAVLFSGASGSVRAGAGFSAFSSAKFALRGLSQALAREHEADNIHVIHALIDGLIWSDKTQQRFSGSVKAGSIDAVDLAQVYWQVMHQPRSAWTHELDIKAPPLRAI